MRLRFWNSSHSSTLVMIDGCRDNPKTSAPKRKTFVATYWFAPLIRLTTVMTAATPITTPISVSTLRSLCAQRLDAEITTASERFMVRCDRKAVDADACSIAWIGAREPHPNIRILKLWYFSSSTPRLSVHGKLLDLASAGSPDPSCQTWIHALDLRRKCRGPFGELAGLGLEFLRVGHSPLRRGRRSQWHIRVLISL